MFSTIMQKLNGWRKQSRTGTGKYRFLVHLLGLVFGLYLTADASADERLLQDISFSALAGNQAEITLVLSSSVPKPESFTTDNPARIAIDLPDTHLGLTSRFQKIGVGVVQSITAVEASGRTRVVVNLTSLAPHEIKQDGNRVLITLNKLESTSSLPTDAHVSSLSSANEIFAPKPAAAAGRIIEDIDFRRGNNGEGRIIVTLSTTAIGVDVRQQGNDVIVSFQGAQIPSALRRRLDVTDFATPVHTIDTVPKDNNVRMVIQNGENFEHLAYQSDRIFTVEIRPLTKEQQEIVKKERVGFSGERLSLNFQNIDVRAVLQLIADFTQLNIVTSDTVQGTLTLRLTNVPWDQALDIILKSKGLGMRRTNNVIMIARNEELTAREKQELEAQKAVKELAPLHSEIMQVNYAKASEIQSLLKAKENSLLSARGNVAVDERTNALLVQDTADNLSEIRQLITTLDVPIKQVLIESRIISASDNFAKELGVKFGATGIAQRGSNFGAVSGNLSGTDGMANSAIDNLKNTGSSYPVALPSSDDRLNVSLPTAGKTGSIAFALLGSRYLLDLELSALQTEGTAEVISNPRVITSNQKEAIIEQGVEIPYQQASSSGATNVAFKKAVLSLNVKPQITPDDRILLTIKVNKDARGIETNGIPSIETKKISTEVLVDNGETLVLGGIYEENKSKAINRVPFLGDLPIVGALFRSNSNKHDKNELLIFVTPRILKQSLAIK
ncbi:Fimbrial assembly protein PilQ [Gammaproteobacteria bacterium]